MKQYYIYKTTNLINNKQYIGKHYGELNDDYIGSGILMQRAISKYGKVNFKKEILCISKNEEENRLNEDKFIRKYDAVNRDDFYNLCYGGQGGDLIGDNKAKRLEVNAKISNANSGCNHHMFGKHHTEETKEKLRESSKRYWTEEKREERSKAYTGTNNPMYGKHHTKEAIEKSVAKKRKKVYQLDKDTLNLIQEYPSIKEAERSLGVSHGLIGRVLDKENKTSYGFKWKSKM